MNLQACSFLTYENIHSDVVTFLRHRGHNVLDVREAGLIGASDVELIRLAHAEGRVVLTHDRDFGRLVVSGAEPFTGIIYLRPGHLEPEFTVRTIRVLFAEAPALRRGFIAVAQRREARVQLRVRYLQ